MREWLLQANAMNPQLRMVCGFQPPFEADADAMAVITARTASADDFTMIYSTPEIEIYRIQTLVRPTGVMLYDLKFIASLVGYESWIISQGLIAVNHVSQLDWQIKRAKRRLIAMINDVWGIDLMKKGASA